MLDPPRNGEGDQPQAGGGGSPLGAVLTESPLHHSLRERSPSPFQGGSLVAAVVLLFDQVSKWAVIHPLALAERGTIELLPIFRLAWVENRGVSLGLLTADGALGRWLLTAFTAAIASTVAVWLWRERRLADSLALGAILGGALGNIADRVRLGHVVDFLQLHFGAWSPFLVFNIADAAISVGVAWLVLRALFTRDPASAHGEQE